MEVSAVKAGAEEATAAAQNNAEKTVEDEFAAGFFQSYSDLKRRVAMDHPAWDLSAYLRVVSDCQEAKVSTEGRDALIEVSAGSAKGEDAAREAEEVRGQDAGETQVIGASEETVLIMDDEPTA